MTAPRTAGYVLGCAVALLFSVISLGGLLRPETYAHETVAWATQAIAQDWFDLAVAPLIAIATVATANGSTRARYVLCGALLFAAYVSAIYCFSIHFNALFLVYCAAFGASLFGFGLVAAGLIADRDLADEACVPRRLTAITLIAIGGGFALLWLGQIVPAIASGGVPPELAASNLPANPVHVLDLAIVLPLHVFAGIAVLRRWRVGPLLAPVVLAFGALMAASIAVLLVLFEVSGLGGNLAMAFTMLAIAALEATLLIVSLRGLRARAMH